jgi:UBX domain-containing protein 7
MPTKRNKRAKDSMSQFVAFTGANVNVAKHFLSVSSGNLEEAVELFFAGNGEYSSACFGLPKYEVPVPAKKQKLVDSDTERVGDSRLGPVVNNHHVSVSAGEKRSFRLETRENSRLDRSITAASSATQAVNFNALFAPPKHIVFKGNFNSATISARKQNKMLLVNIQKHTVFDCHRLNRDVWRNDAVRDIIMSSSVFWMANEGHQYSKDYNVKVYPHVAIIDPITSGELCILVSGGAMSPEVFLQKYQDFMDRNETLFDSSLRKEDTHSREYSFSTAVDLTCPEPDQLLQTAAFTDENGGATTSTAVSSDPSNKTSEQHKERMHGQFGHLPDEPSSDEVEVTSIALKLPNGKRRIRRFRLREPVRCIFAYAEKELCLLCTHDSFKFSSFQLLLVCPFRSLKEDIDNCIGKVSNLPASNVILKLS